MCFYFGKNALSGFGIPEQIPLGLCEQFVWQQTELCVFRVVPFGATLFLFKDGGLNMLPERENYVDDRETQGVIGARDPC